jgi:hypothetical protein
MPTYTQIGSAVTVGAGGAATISFTSIPATYTDLVVKLSGRVNDTNPNIFLSINGSTSTFTAIALYGDGAGAASTNAVPRIAAYVSGSSNTSNAFGTADIYLPNYLASTNKSWTSDTASETNAATAYAGLLTGLWATTSAITSLTFTPSTGSFVQHSTAYLYGVSNA